MRNWVRFGSAAILALTPVLGLADATPTPGISPGYQACLDKAGGVTAGMRACAAAEDTRQEARLNAGYQALMSKLPAPRQALLRDAERAWLAFRKSDCAFAGSAFTGGTFEPVAADDCVVTLTARRADDLADQLDQENAR
jgi:uncharacterized protein YecT (DUF1311 family)